MANELSLKWIGNRNFEASLNGFVLNMSENAKTSGVIDNPKRLMLISLIACTAFDVVPLLEKMRTPFSAFEVSVSADQTDEHPRIYRNVHLVYLFKGESLDKGKIEKAVNLSQEKYCGVSEMFRRFSKLTYEIRYEQV